VFVKRFECLKKLTSDFIGRRAVPEDFDAELDMFEVGIDLFGGELVQLLLDDTVED